MDIGPAIQPICARDQAKESTPDPTTAVIMWEHVVHTVPASYQDIKYNIIQSKKQR